MGSVTLPHVYMRQGLAQERVQKLTEKTDCEQLHDAYTLLNMIWYICP